jgi:hypothetical protein
MVDEENEMKTVSAINTAILSGNFNADELKSIQNALKAAYTRMQTVAKFSYQRGDRVYFTTKNGDKVMGVVDKINQKTITVNTVTSIWKVSPSLLRKA